MKSMAGRERSEERNDQNQEETRVDRMAFGADLKD